MKKLLLVLFGLFMFAGFINSQVIANFDKAGSLGIFKNADFGTLTDSIYQTTDPTGKSAGVMDVEFNLKGVNDHNAIRPITQQLIDPSGAQQLTYWVYIPKNSGIPDSLVIGLWWQVNGNWAWNELDYYAKDIPKGVWYPISVPLADSSLADPVNDGLTGHKLGDFGIQWNNIHCQSTIWKGSIYIDNVSLIGANPTTFANFKINVSGFSEQWNNGWKDTIYQTSQPIGDSIGVLALKLTNGIAKTGGTSVGIAPLNGFDATKHNFLVAWVYIDTTFSDSAYIQVWAQDNHNWNWPGPMGITTYLGTSIPRNVWYPLYFDLLQASVADTVSGGLFNSLKYPLGKFGVQVDGPTDWNSTVYIGNFEFIDSIVSIPNKWVAANFENASYGLQGFVVPNYAGGTISRIHDTTGNGTYVMEGDIDFSKAPNKFAALTNIPLMDSTSNYATKASFDIYIPSGMPSGSDVQFIITGAAAINPTWIQFDNKVGTGLAAGQWNTISMNIDSLVKSGGIDPTKEAQVGVQVLGPTASTWTGKLFFDNLTFYGIVKPSQLTFVKNTDSNLPKEYKLYNNYPNPFNPTTIIKYDLPKQSNVVIKVYDVLGKEIATLVNENEKAGTYNVNFRADNLASGMYIYRITAGSYIKSEKMMLLK